MFYFDCIGWIKTGYPNRNVRENVFFYVKQKKKLT